jgi:hypothetical protein
VLFIKSGSSFLLGIFWDLTAKGIIQRLFFWRQPDEIWPHAFLINRLDQRAQLCFPMTLILVWLSTRLIPTVKLLHTAGMIFVKWKKAGILAHPPERFFSSLHLLIFFAAMGVRKHYLTL